MPPKILSDLRGVEFTPLLERGLADLVPLRVVFVAPAGTTHLACCSLAGGDKSLLASKLPLLGLAGKSTWKPPQMSAFRLNLRAP